jgi:5'-3' exonuclease
MNLLVDINNIAFATRFAKIKTPKNRRHKEKFVTESLVREMFSWVINIAHANKCTGLVIARDSKNVWRRDIYPLYKAGSTSDEDVYYSEILAAADMLCDYVKHHTAGYVVAAERCEADDVIAVWCQESDTPSLIMSTDKDYVQLVNENVKLYSPVQKVFREPEDAQYELFLKCIRGDKNDNIRSAFPRVRETVLKAAWGDDYKLLNLLETVKKDGTKVADSFELNQKLIDLSMQPQEIRDSIVSAIEQFVPSSYSMFDTQKYFKDHNLGDSQKITDYKDKVLKTPPVFKQD